MEQKRFHYLDAWYNRCNYEWQPFPQFPKTKTILSPKVTSFQHIDIAKYHSCLALSEREWRKDLLVAFGDKDGEYHKVPYYLNEDNIKKPNSYIGIIAGSYKESMEREWGHLACIDYHMRQRRLKEEKLLKILEGG